MPRGDKSKYTDKQKRQAEHIAEGYIERGVSKKTAKARAWATVNQETGGGNLSGSGRGKPDTHEASRRGGKKAAAKRSKRARAGGTKKAAAKRSPSKRAGGTKRAGTKRTGTKRAGTKRTAKRT
jgi:plasmid stabilization system protein ParE